MIGIVILPIDSLDYIDLLPSFEIMDWEYNGEYEVYITGYSEAFEMEGDRNYQFYTLDAVDEDDYNLMLVLDKKYQKDDD